jgi:hypothetical protein
MPLPKSIFQPVCYWQPKDHRNPEIKCTYSKIHKYFARGNVTSYWRSGQFEKLNCSKKPHQNQTISLYLLQCIYWVSSLQASPPKPRGEAWTGFWWGSLRGRDNWGDPDVDGIRILRWIFRKLEGVVGTGWNGLRIGTRGGHLWVR